MSERDSIELAAMDLFEQSLDQPLLDRRVWIEQQTESPAPVRERAAELLRLDQQSQDIEWTGAALSIASEQDSPLLARVGAYRITRMIAQGGMGAVYEGVREAGDFEHKVAIKVIRPGLLKDTLIERFERERQVLAEMNHPNVARLFDGGTLPDGAPFIVMEFVDGIGIDKYCNDHALDVSARLALFAKVCTAVRHAHQNLIVHRDITPSNVLVDRDSEPKLIDFGIAKPDSGQSAEPVAVNDTDRLTNGPPSLASLSFTPGFAAPERSTGAPANTLSDIYSLGKLLEALLAPVTKNRDTDAIIAKAVSEEPEVRYATVNALREDVARFTSGFPPDAAHASTSYRASKFIARHKTASFVGATVALGFIAAFAVTFYQYQRAEAALVEADNRFAEVRELANFQLFDLYDELLEIPGTTKVLSQIADKSRAYLGALGNDRRASSALQLDIALSYKRLSDVLGNPEGANLGRREESGEMLQAAYDKLAALNRDEPLNEAVQRALAETAYALSIYKFIAEDDNEAAIKYAAQAETLYKALNRNGSGTTADHLSQLSAELQAAKPLLWMGKGEEGVEAMQVLRSKIDAYQKNRPDNPKVKALSANIHSELADTMAWYYDESGGDHNEALPIMAKALRIFRELNAADPENYEIRRNLASSHYKRAQIFMSLEDNRRTLRDMRTAENYLVELLKVDENDQNAARILQVVQGEMVMTLAQLGRADESIALGRKILAEKRRASQREPNNPGLFRDYTNGLFTYATAMKTLGRKSEACDLYRASMKNWDIIKAKGGLMEHDKQGAVKEISENLTQCR